MMTGPIFVDDNLFLGRVDEQQRFRHVLDNVLHETRAGILSPHPLPEPSWAHVVLVYGTGGMGKTTLCKRLRDIACGSGSLPDDRYRGKFRVISLDWEVRSDRDIRLTARESVTFEAILAHLRDVCRDAGIQKEFQKYDADCRRLEQIDTHVDHLLAVDADEDSDSYSALRKLGSVGLAQVLRRHLPGVVNSVDQEDLIGGLSDIFKGGMDSLGQLRRLADEWLQKRLKDDEYRLFMNPSESLAMTFADALRLSSRSKPVTMMLDTYEIVDAKDAWLRLVMSRCGERVIWVVSGRDNLVESRAFGGAYFLGYNGEVPPERFRAFPMSEFNQGDIVAYFARRVPDRSLSPTQAGAIHHATFGIPLAVKTAAAIWARGASVEAITEGLPERANRDEVVKTMAERFLVHALNDTQHPEDVNRLYCLATMYQPEFEALAALWDLRDVRPSLDDLERRYDFVFAYEMHLHEVVRDYIRKYLLAPVERQRPAFVTAHRRATALLESRLRSAADDLTTLEDRLQDDRWVDTAVGLMWHRMWVDTDLGWKTFELALLPAIAYDLKLARVLLNQVSFFSPIISHGYKQQLRKWRALVEKGWLDSGDLLVDTLKSSLMGTEVEPNYGCATETTAIVTWLRGRVASHADDLRSAANFFIEAAGHLPNRGRALCKITCRELTQVGEALSENPKTIDLAISSFERAANLDSTLSRPRHALGHIYEEQGMINEAIEMFAQARDINPRHSHNWGCLGRLYEKQGKLEEAIQAYTEAIERDEEGDLSATYLEQLGRLYLDREDFERSSELLERATRLKPDAYGAWCHLGVVYLQSEQLDKSSRAYRKATNSPNPSIKVAALCGLGDTLRHRQLNERARTSYEQALTLRPDCDVAWHALGHLHQDEGDLEEAYYSFKRAHEENPARPDHPSCMARVCQELNKLDEAATHFLASIQCEKKAETRAGIWYEVGLVYLHLDRAEDAVEALKNASDVTSDRAIYWLILGNACEEAQHIQDAVAAYRRALALGLDKQIDDKENGPQLMSQIRHYITENGS